MEKNDNESVEIQVENVSDDDLLRILKQAGKENPEADLVSVTRSCISGPVTVVTTTTVEY